MLLRRRTKGETLRKGIERKREKRREITSGEKETDRRDMHGHQGDKVGKEQECIKTNIKA